MTATDSIPAAARPPLSAEAIAQLAHKEALTLPEAAALGYGSERALRQMITTKRLERSVLRVGRRGVRLLRDVLIEELRNRPRN